MRAAFLFACLLATAWATDVFLAENAKMGGVVVLPSGLQYKVLQSASPGGPKPTQNQKCKCHYTGTLVDGSTFDSSRKRGRPATFAPSGVIAGWTEALQLMSPGDRWELVIPSKLGYGVRGMGRTIPGGATLIFDLELIEIVEGGGFFDSLPLPLPMMLGGLAIALYAVYSVFVSGDGKKVSASHILVKDEATAQSLKAKLDEIESASVDSVQTMFADLAQKNSTCPSSRSGGSLGSFSPGQMVPAFDKVCFDPSVPVGHVQGPVQTQFGYHLILVTERADPDKKE